LVIPLSIIASNLARFGIQLLLFLGVYTTYIFTDHPPSATMALLAVPFLVVLMAFLGLGMGLIVSALTIKYRDLAFLVSFGTQLLMFVTPIIYPLSSVPTTSKWVILLNPITAIIETFRYAFLSTGRFDLHNLIYSAVLILSILFCGLILYHKVQRNFIDII
jgi:lipopolysaccharide transport system permease protein